MKAEIITIGDEILIGQIVDTNSAWMAHELNSFEIDIHKITSISDNKEEIFKAIDEAKKNVDLIILTGGLGPTDDDYTKDALADYFNCKQIINTEVLEHIKKLVLKRGGELNTRNKNQALVPETCKVIPNDIGTAPGMWFEFEGKILISIPGVPFEMKEMMLKYIIPNLKKISTNDHVIHKLVLTQGISESKLAEMLEEWESKLPVGLKLAYLPSPGIIKLRLSAKGPDKSVLENIINESIRTLSVTIPDYICGFDAESIEEVLAKTLSNKSYTISVAESCTGGNISHLITCITGSSNYFKGSVIAYSNEIKEELLGVNNSILRTYGAVSKQTVEAMAIGVRQLLKTDYSIATTGIAGPTGGTNEKPVGTTWIAVSNSAGVVSKKFIFSDDRNRNIQRASLTAINMLLKLINIKEI
jgi:nicotinamide-nucleotide amidase